MIPLGLFLVSIFSWAAIGAMIGSSVGFSLGRRSARRAHSKAEPGLEEKIGKEMIAHGEALLLQHKTSGMDVRMNGVLMMRGRPFFIILAPAPVDAPVRFEEPTR